VLERRIDVEGLRDGETRGALLRQQAATPKGVIKDLSATRICRWRGFVGGKDLESTRIQSQNGFGGVEDLEAARIL